MFKTFRCLKNKSEANTITQGNTFIIDRFCEGDENPITQPIAAAY